MRLSAWLISILFIAFGLSPYHKAKNVDTSKPNQLIIDLQQCGCPCPDASVIKGQIQIPSEIAIKYTALDTKQINLDIKEFNEPYNYELGHARLFITGKVVGLHTILCEPTNCELAPHFQVDSWGLINSVARAWTFPNWAGFSFLLNLIIIFPALTVFEIMNRIRNRKANNTNS